MTIPVTAAADRGSIPKLPVAVTPALRSVIDHRYNALMGGVRLPSDLALSPDHIRALENRLRALDFCLRPGPERPVLLALSAMLGVLPGRKETDDDASIQRHAYSKALAGLPGFAACRACEIALTRGIGDKRFTPTPPALRDVAVLVAQPFLVERSRIQAVLSAEIDPPRSPPERRAALAAAARRAVGLTSPSPDTSACR